jgi:MFS family permease
MPARTTWSPDRRLLTTGIVGLITAVAFEGMAVPTVLPATVDDLGGLSLYGWAFAAFWLTTIVGITVAGADADRHGPLRALGSGLALFCVGLLCSGAAVGMPMVIVGRAVQGLGSGAIGSVVYVVIARSYDRRAMPRMLALNSSAWVVPGLVGPVLAAWVVSALSWRWVFAGLVPAVVLAGAAVLVPVGRLGPSREQGQHPGGQALLALRLALGSALVLGSLTIGTPLGALPMLAVGGWLTVSSLRPLLPAGSLAVRPGSPAVIGTIGLVAFGFFGTEAFVPLAVTGVRHGSLQLGGLTLSAAAVTWTTGSWIQARLAPRGWRRGLVRVGVLLIGAGIGLAAVALLPQAPLATTALAWAVAGLGMGLAYSTLTLLVLETAAPGREGAASAGLQLAFTLGTAFGSGVGGGLVALADGGILPLAAAIGVSDGLMLLVTLVAVAAAARVPSRDPRAGASSPAIEQPLTSPAGQLGGPLGEEAPGPPM